MLYTVDATKGGEVVHVSPMSGNRLDLDANQLLRLYREGASVKALAEKFGCSRNVIDRRLKELGVTPRGRSEAMLLRQAQMTPEERLALLEKAHAAARSRVHGEEELVLRAQRRFVNQTGSSAYQQLVKGLLEARGYEEVLLEFPQGKYNLDLAIHEVSVAVELHGGGWHRYGRHWARRQQRIEQILSAGWKLIEVWGVGMSGWNAEKVADQIVAIAKGSGPDPSPGCKHWMLACDGNPARILCSEGYDVAPVAGFVRREDSSSRYAAVSRDAVGM